jgi:hypothetical protein
MLNAPAEGSPEFPGSNGASIAVSVDKAMSTLICPRAPNITVQWYDEYQAYITTVDCGVGFVHYYMHNDPAQIEVLPPSSPKKGDPLEGLGKSLRQLFAEQEGAKDAEKEKEKEGCVCQGCGRRYRVDVLVPDGLWSRIRPEGKAPDAGLLCGACIFTRIEELGEFYAFTMAEDEQRSDEGCKALPARAEKCPKCDGEGQGEFLRDGELDAGLMVECPRCKGSGRV